MSSFYSNNYLANRPIERAMKVFARRFSANQKILDIGCGRKPYAKFFRAEYIGLDPLEKVKPDIVGEAWSIPVPDNSFDGVILNQSLEHIAKIHDTIAEVGRILKPGGYAIITTPQTMRNHSQALPAHQAPTNNFDQTQHPYWHVDYYRFTKFGLIYLWKDFEVISLVETNGYVSAVCQLINYFFASFGRDWLWTPIYVMMNCLGLIADNTLGKINSASGAAHKFNHFTYSSLTINLILIVQKPNRP